jgi:hypothetical protein
MGLGGSAVPGCSGRMTPIHRNAGQTRKAFVRYPTEAAGLASVVNDPDVSILSEKYSVLDYLHAKFTVLCHTVAAQ